jgi:hypothetical protein
LARKWVGNSSAKYTATLLVNDTMLALMLVTNRIAYHPAEAPQMPGERQLLG